MPKKHKAKGGKSDKGHNKFSGPRNANGLNKSFVSSSSTPRRDGRFNNGQSHDH